MSEKLDKIGADRDRAKEKRDLWDSRYKELCQKYTQQENTEIHEMVRARNLTPDQLAEVLKALQGGLFPSPAAMPGAGAPGMQAGRDNNTSEIKEDKQDEI